MNLNEQRKSAIASARRIAQSAKAQDRDLTTTELAEINGLLDGVKSLDVKIKAAEDGDALLARLGALGPGENATPTGSTGVLGLTGASRTMLAREIAGKMLGGSMMGGGFGSNSLMPTGSVVVSVPLIPSPFELGQIPANLLAALPLIQHDVPAYSYLRQTSRTNAAAPVLPGDPKPVSQYGIVRVDAGLEVVAHLSEPINSYWLTDNTQLGSFVADELLYGLNRAIENQIVNGSGVSPQLHGILTTSGIQTQAAVGTDLLGTTRSAITAVENAGEIPGLFVFTPADWERIELSRTVGSGQLEMTMPVDRAKQQLWGVQIVTSTALAVGTGLLIDRDSISVDTDRGVSVLWNPWSGFQTNEVVARCEGRFQVSIYQPAGICRITLPAVGP